GSKTFIIHLGISEDGREVPRMVEIPRMVEKYAKVQVGDIYLCVLSFVKCHLSNVNRQTPSVKRLCSFM
ncbi:MAG: hypothetical protein KTM48_04150, partial [Wolbachia endosymbiont of Pissodes strobi]|nr:hypothetical protein [Wolbachia endosymbiont of Pissodes strobi]